MVSQRLVGRRSSCELRPDQRRRAAGVPVETRKVLLGHENGDITTRYSAPELEELIGAVEKVCGKSPALVVLKRKAATS